jgi:hypothetical protein
MNGARPAVSTCAMHVKKDRAIALAQGVAVQTGERPPDLMKRAGRNMARNDRVRHAGQASVPQMHVGAADFRACRTQQRPTGRQIGTVELSDFDRLEGCWHHCGQDAVIHAGTLPCHVDSRTCFLALVITALASTASAQTYTLKKARRHFITISSDWLYTKPLHFAEHPLADLVGKEVASTQFEVFEYRTRDDTTQIDVIEFSRRQRGGAVSLYPLGMSSGPTLMLRGSYEQLPRMQIAFDGPSPVARYELTGGRAVDGAVGVVVADRSAGWGLGSHAFVAGGVGRITSELGDGRRIFAEGGGGLGFGPFGVELGVKFARNKLSKPVDHHFLTVPITLRGTLTF